MASPCLSHLISDQMKQSLQQILEVTTAPKRVIVNCGINQGSVWSKDKKKNIKHSVIHQE